MQKIEISVWEGKTELWTGISKTPLEIGRQQEGDSAPLELQDLVSSQRLVIAPVSARSIPRQALRVESPSEGQLRICNIHPRLSFYVGTEAEPLGPGEAFEATDEIVVSLPENRTVRVQSCARTVWFRRPATRWLRTFAPFRRRSNRRWRISRRFG